VREISSDGETATIELALDDDKVALIPANIDAAIVPKTLFGEKYVSLEIPESGPSGTIRAGAVIDRTEVSTELEAVLADLYPLLHTVRHADLNMTLTAMATALEGRGDALGDNLETLDSYLKRLNPEIPALLEDLRLTAEVSDVYADILPEVAQILDDTVKTTGTLEEREVALTATLRDVRSFSDTARAFLDANAERLQRLGELSTQTLRVLARYAPTFPCMSKAIVKTQTRLAETFRGFELHIVLETLKEQPRAYTHEDRPFFGADNGPNCVGLPNPPYSQENPAPGQPRIKDGMNGSTGKGNHRVAPGSGFGYFGTPDDVSALRSMLAQRYGDSGSDMDVLLAGPLVAEGGDRR
jgi:phospholipid/cholesterol/gamma-HCH transport system substrate-binding protein